MVGKNIWGTLKTYTSIVAILILYLILAPITILVIFCPIYIFRGLLSQLRKIFRKDLDKLLNTRSAVLARENWSEEPKWNLVVWLTQEGLMDLDKFRKDFYNDYVMARGSDGKLLYPEYQQHYYNWMGFLFWRWENAFNIKEHIRIYDGIREDEVVDRKGLIQIIKELTWRGWNPRKSPWEFLQIPKYREDCADKVNKSMLIFRIHHGLGDGYYILKLITQDIGGISLDHALGKPQWDRRNWLGSIALEILFWIRAPFQMVEMLVTAQDGINSVHLPMEAVSKPMNAAWTKPIDLGMIKSIKNSYHVSFSAVIYAALTGGIRNIMLERGLKIPKKMHTAIAVPIPGHSYKLRNNFIFSFIELPIGVSDPVERLLKMDSNYTSLRRSGAPRLNFGMVPLFGALPGWMYKPLCINWLSTCLVSNFPGTPEYHFKGVRVIDMMFNAGLGEGSVGFGFCLISYVDHIGLITQVDPGILPTDADVEKLNEKIFEEFTILRGLGALGGRVSKADDNFNSFK